MNLHKIAATRDGQWLAFAEADIEPQILAIEAEARTLGNKELREAAQAVIDSAIPVMGELYTPVLTAKAIKLRDILDEQ